jgi:hypothetical protein
LKIKSIKLLGTVVAISVGLTACATFGTADNRWVEYKTWTKITEGRVSTGDPTGFVGTVHAGPKGYRDIYVNKAALATNQGSAPYNYPIGSVLVKEQYKDKAAWEAQKSPDLTIMVKVAASDSPSVANWKFAAGYTGTAEDNAFCAGCHSIVAQNDFVFTNEDFFDKQ